tara:strand:+ start:232 stop:744 length:513 start_codon:yes stop_codon:yes gene_type:complete
MSDRELLVGNATHTMRDPAFIAGLTNTFDGTNATLVFVENLPEIRFVDELDSTNFVVVCNKAADLTFTWQISNVKNFPSTDTTTLAAGNVDGLDVITITSVVGEGTSTLSLSKISNAYMSKYFRCKITFTTPSPNEIKNSLSCLLEINTGGSTESTDAKIIDAIIKEGGQ